MTNKPGSQPWVIHITLLHWLASVFCNSRYYKWIWCWSKELTKIELCCIIRHVFKIHFLAGNSAFYAWLSNWLIKFKVSSRSSWVTFFYETGGCTLLRLYSIRSQFRGSLSKNSASVIGGWSAFHNLRCLSPQGRVQLLFRQNSTVKC